MKPNPENPLNNTLIERIETRRKLFNSEVEQIWSNNNRHESNSLWISVRRKLSQFNLSNSFTEAQILSEAYYRGINAIDEGKEIANPIAWMRLTCYNYISELSRAQKKNLQIDNHDEIIAPEREEDEEEEEGLLNRKKRKHKVVNKAFQNLPHLDQKIIKLKVIDGISFKEIRSQLKEQGEADFTEQALRKRKQRAIKRLREDYCSLVSVS